MEGDNNNVVVDISVSGGAAAAAAAAGYSRWNPTKEQIEMLEGLYKQGIRTPSAEQIQQITTRLRAFGHIEGKNVFYWFQNHKARQRQKQKQDTISYFNRFLHHHHKNTSSVFPPCPNNVCSPFCIPYTDLALSHNHHHHQQQPKVLLPRAIKRKPFQPEKMAITATNINIPSGSTTGAIYKDVVGYVNVHEEYCSRSSNKQTLDLFPLQPTGDLLQARTSSSSRPSIASVSSGNIHSTPETSSSSDNKCIVDQQGSGSTSSGGNGHLCFFNFFCHESH